MNAKKLIIIAISALLVFVIGASVKKDIDNGLNDKGFPDDGGTLSVAMAKEKKVFVCDVSLKPDQIQFEGKQIHFVSAWIERKAKSTPFFIWWWTLEYRPGYYLVIHCQPEGSIEDQKLWLARDDQGHSFGMHGTNSFDDALNDEEFKAGKAQLYIVRDWHAPRTNSTAASWKP